MNYYEKMKDEAAKKDSDYRLRLLYNNPDLNSYNTFLRGYDASTLYHQSLLDSQKQSFDNIFRQTEERDKEKDVTIGGLKRNIAERDVMISKLEVTLKIYASEEWLDCTQNEAKKALTELSEWREKNK